MKRVKIVATIGPSSWAPEVMAKMIKAGMNVARINGAFADVPELKRVAEVVRSQSQEVALLLDIKGHEIRLNKFSENLHVNPGDEVIIGSSEADAIYPVTYPELWQDIAAGQILLVDKGATTLEVTKVADGKIYCKVINGNIIASGKGMNTPGAKLKNPTITKRDIEQMEFAIADGWDFIAASFVRNADDIRAVKAVTKDSPIKIVAKIEDQQGVDNIEDIIEVADAIMVARGDMGSEMPYEKLPILQKEMIFKCNQAAKPVITATNMLESMTENIMPTRAEITDVANAVLDGSDALMTSAETTSGKYPVETLEAMSRIANETEKYIHPEIIEDFDECQYPVHIAMANAAFEFILALPDVTKIIVYSHTGVTPKLLARHNLPLPIIALVKNDTLKRQLALTKNVAAYTFAKDFSDRDKAVTEMINFTIEVGAINKDDKVLVIGNCKYSAAKESSHPNIFEYIVVENLLD